ncbi:MAG: permease [Pseudodesulfovibrio sp.]|uniref:Permease n=1 Tax=Pseudodesulfovibrio aespoeensis (strain ATCC 700646 / DSM 10631 / Aspo-2) TaxID=643562 RepID=E6VXR6_PSEA9|nr:MULTISPECIES: permease [Pseudodesulfovibrio]MBU4193350.1 permease [Pseudomonadota bacterium]MBV1737514.1 permease [Desulfarculus sp.]ADU61524.1 permease [Pseudodesulfovibrio aespoeensis Aspo-2]MBU4244529.1 permease [Pseudomonadota bacterium]MBU4379074.1 permease [Pseudomonadota bacterium]
MTWKTEWKPLAVVLGVFLAFYYLPLGGERFDNAVFEALYLAKDYAQEHVLLCLVPAFFIAGAIGVFISQASVMKYLGPKANKAVAYGVASCSGTILAVCSCTILPLFAGIWRMGAGLGPASAFLYAGPAINILAVILTARILGPGLGIARALGAIVFSIVIGLLMHFFFRKEEHAKAARMAEMPEPEVARPLWQNAVYFATMIGVLVFANWGKPTEATGLWHAIHSAKWIITSLFALGFAACLVGWFNVRLWHMVLAALPAAALGLLFPQMPQLAFVAGVIGLSMLTSTREDELGEWFGQSWGFAKQILPLLLFGVLIAGMLLGRPGHEGLIPSEWVSQAVGGNSLLSNFVASFAGAFMYFATLTEVPILQGLIGNGMGQGPALALLLAGPALSLPNMLVIRSVMGTQKTVVFVLLVVVMATISGMLYGTFFG